MYASEERGSSSSPPPFPVPQPYMNGTNGNAVNGSINGHLSRQSSIVDYASIPPPPPLMPRPPKEYIQETQEEDQAFSAKIEAMDKDSGSASITHAFDSNIELRPFTPFSADFDNRASAAPPPPLPPKVPLEIL